MLLYSGSNFSALLYNLGDKNQFTHQLFIVFLNLIFFLGACSNDVKLNEEWEDKIIVYCVLNQKDTAHYVRIQRIYYGEGNNLISHTEPDSIYYNQDIDVRLERWKDDQLIEILNLEKTNDILKDSGYFTPVNHVLYKTNSTIFPDSKYELKIFIPSLNKSVSATTNLIMDFGLSDETYNYFKEYVDFSRGGTFPYGWTTSEYSKVFQPIIIFNYSKTTYNSFENKSIKWYLPRTLSINTTGNEHIELNILKSNFLRLVGTAIDEIGHFDFHRPEYIEIRIEVATDELYTYRQLNGIGFASNPDVPVFTNIENGYGIFTSRNYFIFHGNNLDGRTWDSLACGQYTKHLNFLNQWGNLHECF